MKNPKVGERVAFDEPVGTIKATVLKVEEGGLQLVLDVLTDNGVTYTLGADELRRLVPKKKRRTYTEAEIEKAYFKMIEGPILCLRLLELLREGSGR